MKSHLFSLFSLTQGTLVLLIITVDSFKSLNAITPLDMIELWF